MPKIAEKLAEIAKMSQFRNRHNCMKLLIITSQCLVHQNYFVEAKIANVLTQKLMLKGAMTSEDLPGTQFLRHSVHQFGQSKEFHDSQEKRAEEILAKSILVRTLSDSKLDAICDFNDDIERKTLPNNLNRRKVT